MPTPAPPQQRYDHRLRYLVQRTGDITVATGLGVPGPRRAGGCVRRQSRWCPWRLRTSVNRNSDRRSRSYGDASRSSRRRCSISRFAIDPGDAVSTSLAAVSAIVTRLSCKVACCSRYPSSIRRLSRRVRVCGPSASSLAICAAPRVLIAAADGSGWSRRRPRILLAGPPALLARVRSPWTDEREHGGSHRCDRKER